MSAAVMMPEGRHPGERHQLVVDRGVVVTEAQAAAPEAARCEESSKSKTAGTVRQ